MQRLPRYFQSSHLHTPHPLDIINTPHNRGILLQLINQYWHIIITQSPWFTLQLIHGTVQCFLCLQNCIMACLHHYSIIHSNFTTLKILSALFIPSLNPQQPRNFFQPSSYSFAFYRMSYRVGIIQYTVSSDWLLSLSSTQLELPQWLISKEICLQCRSHRRRRFNPWVGKIPWRRARQPTIIFLLRESMDRGAW